MIENIVVGVPKITPQSIFAFSFKDWIEVERPKTMFTSERFLPKLMVESGIVKSISEVRRNKPELFVALDSPGYFEIKWGKKRLFILVGE